MGRPHEDWASGGVRAPLEWARWRSPPPRGACAAAFGASVPIPAPFTLAAYNKELAWLNSRPIHIITRAKWQTGPLNRTTKKNAGRHFWRGPAPSSDRAAPSVPRCCRCATARAAARAPRCAPLRLPLRPAVPLRPPRSAAEAKLAAHSRGPRSLCAPAGPAPATAPANGPDQVAEKNGRA